MQRPSSRCVKTLALQPIAKMLWVGLRLAWSGRSGKSHQTLFFPFLTPLRLPLCKSGRRKGWCERKEVVGGSLLVRPGLAWSGLDNADQTRLDQTPPILSVHLSFPFSLFPFSFHLVIANERKGEGKNGMESKRWCVGLRWPGLAWPGLVSSGLAWSDLAWSGLVWKMQIRPDQTLFFPFLTPLRLRECRGGRMKGWCERQEVVGGSVLAWSGLAWLGFVWSGLVWLDLAWSSPVWKMQTRPN